MNENIKLIEIPKWGLSMEEGTVTQWLINEGESFKSGDELVEIESSKIVNSLEAHFDGVLRKIIAQPGDTLAVGLPIAVAADKSVSDAQIGTFLATLSSEQPSAEPQAQTPQTELKAELETELPVAQATPSPRLAKKQQTSLSDNAELTVPTALSQGEDDSDVHATSHARRFAAQHGINLHNINSSGRNDRISIKDINEAVISAGGVIPRVRQDKLPSESSSKDDSAVPATPVARRLAKALGINLHDCRSSGFHGRVAKADVEAAQALSDTSSANADDKTTQAGESNQQHSTTLSGMRKVIAQRLQQSKQTAPHFRLTVEVEIDALMQAKEKINNAYSSVKLSVNDFVVKATAAALIKVPSCNVQFDGSTVTYFKDADIAIAVALEEGLITPIIKQSNNKGLIEISNECRHLVTKAKAGTLSADEFQGGTFSISNLGMYGVKHFDAIINPPQGAILAIGAAQQQVVVKDGEQVIAMVMSITLSSDHRIIDGAQGALLLKEIKIMLESPVMLVA